MGCLLIVAANDLRFTLLVSGIVGTCRHKPTRTPFKMMLDNYTDTAVQYKRLGSIYLKYGSSCSTKFFIVVSTDLEKSSPSP
jgi:hypothetical protein